MKVLKLIALLVFFSDCRSCRVSIGQHLHTRSRSNGRQCSDRGFIIGGSETKTVLIRARGPTLTDFGVPGELANPFMQLFSGQTVIAQNDNWRDTHEAEISATALGPCQVNPG